VPETLPDLRSCAFAACPANSASLSVNAAPVARLVRTWKQRP
jgi:hypothetical protein